MIIGSIGMSIAMFLLALTFISGHARAIRAHLHYGYLAAFGFSWVRGVVILAEFVPNRVRSMQWPSPFSCFGAQFYRHLTFVSVEQREGVRIRHLWRNVRALPALCHEIPS